MAPDTPESLASSFQAIMGWRNDLPVLSAHDCLLPKSTQDRIGVELIQEALPEANSNKHLAEALELGDSLVFLLATLVELGVTVDFFQLASDPVTHNGRGKSSVYYEELMTTVDEIPHSMRPEIDSQHALSLILSRIYTISRYSLSEIVELVLEKNRSNRPEKNRFGQQYYGLNWQGRELDEEGIMKRFHHNEKCFHALRAHFGSPLESWMHELVTGLIMNFNHAGNLEKLKDKLGTIDDCLVESFFRGELLVGKKITIDGLDLTVTVRMRDHVLQKAGAVLIEPTR